MREAISDYPNVNLIIGVNTMKMYSNAESASATAHKFGETGKYYDYYNSAIMLNDVDSIPIYHKSKLVIGPEKMPYNQVFKFLEDLMMDNGGFVGSNGLQEEREVFFSNNGKAIAAPIICYEAVFGEYIGDYIKKGANFFAVITNDGWWFNAPIYLQSLGFGKLRAIEHRRSIARSANTGISCFIDQRGSMYKEAKYSTAASIKGTLNLNNELTFYTKTGDYIPKIAIFFSILILLQALVSKLKQKSLKEQ
ncbi:MAG: hypothetical protein C0594_13915 [Marinilabiliales bacterium]|nr:MAG: hypothetical protein C0594_13915 [Marinilabiliales bacterium]